MRKLFYILSLLLTIGFSATAQTDLFDDDVLCARQYNNKYPTDQKQFFGNWERGTVLLENGKTASGYFLRYNQMLDELAWLREDDYNVGLVIKENVREFTQGGIDEGTEPKRFLKVLVPELAGLQKTMMYLQVLADGQTRLFCQHKAKLTTHTGLISPKSYYYLDYGGKLHKISLNRWSFYQTFSKTDRAIVKDVIRKNHLQVHRIVDMARAVELFNAEKSTID